MELMKEIKVKEKPKWIQIMEEHGVFDE